MHQKYSAFTSFPQVCQCWMECTLLILFYLHVFIVSSFSVIDFFLVFKKSIYTKYQCLLSQKKISPGLPYLCPQIRCAQNQYTPVQMDLKYPLRYHYSFHFIRNLSQNFFPSLLHPYHFKIPSGLIASTVEQEKQS